MNLRNFTHSLISAATTVLIGSNLSSHAASVTFQAESGTLGTNYTVRSDGVVQYITNTNNNTGNNPGIPGRVATFTVIFTNVGTYQLYARVRVGTNTFNDDSMFYGNGFGTKSPGTSSDWVLVNGLGSAGFANSTDVVTGGGSLGSSVWKWINLSLFAPGATFSVTADNLTNIFQIGAREDGLDSRLHVHGRRPRRRRTGHAARANCPATAARPGRGQFDSVQ